MSRRKIPKYPHPKPWFRKKHGEWVDVTLYSITGWFATEYICSFSHWATAFGGYFKMGEAKVLKGEIVDIWGGAKIIGAFLSEYSLKFDKFYVNPTSFETCSKVIAYNFTKEIGDEMWEGVFRLTDQIVPPERASEYDWLLDNFYDRAECEGERLSRPSGGKAVCKIIPVISNAFGIISGPLDFLVNPPV